jgi:hypothetical protein
MGGFVTDRNRNTRQRMGNTTPIAATERKVAVTRHRPPR